VLIAVRSHSVLFLHLLPIVPVMACQAYHQNILCSATSPLALPAGWEFLRRGRSGICCQCQLPKIQSPLERKHQSNCNEHFTTKGVLHVGKINGPKEMKIKIIIEILIITVEIK
jgi:hypothetical protein